MSQTYWSLGPGLSPSWFVMGLAFLVLSLFLKRPEHRFSPYLVVVGSAWTLACLLSLPIGLLNFVMVAAIFVMPDSLPQSQGLKALVAAGIVALGAYFAWMTTKGAIQVRPNEIASASAFFSSPHGKGQETIILRKNLDVSALKDTGGPLWVSDTRFWSISNDDDASQDLYWSGREVFLGPHGLIRGDALGRRVAAWANVQPRYWSADDLPPPPKTVP